MQTIVVGYDASRVSERALDRAAQLAHAFGGRVVVVWVAPLPVEPSLEIGGGMAFGLTPYAYPDPSIEGAEDDWWNSHRDRVDAFLRERGVQYELTRTLGAAADALVDAADERHADLIVVGTREPGFWDRLVGGSVSQGVARHAHCDVLIVHAPHE